MRLIDLDNLKEQYEGSGVNARIVNTRNVSVVHVKLAAGAIISEHVHDHEQVVNVVSGQLEHTVNGKRTTLRPGMVLVVPPRVPHSFRALEDTYILDVLSPANKGFKGNHRNATFEIERRLAGVSAGY